MELLSYTLPDGNKKCLIKAYFGNTECFCHVFLLMAPGGVEITSKKFTSAVVKTVPPSGNMSMSFYKAFSNLRKECITASPIRACDIHGLTLLRCPFPHLCLMESVVALQNGWIENTARS